MITIPLPLKGGGSSGGGGGGGSHGGGSSSGGSSHSSGGSSSSGGSHTSSSGGGSAAPKPPSNPPPSSGGGGNTHIVINNHIGSGPGYRPLPGYRPPGYYPRPRYGGLSPFWHPPYVYHPWYHPVLFWPTPANYSAGNVSVLETICTILLVIGAVALTVWAVRRILA